MRVSYNRGTSVVAANIYGHLQEGGLCREWPLGERLLYMLFCSIAASTLRVISVVFQLRHSMSTGSLHSVESSDLPSSPWRQTSAESLVAKVYVEDADTNTTNLYKSIMVGGHWTV